jgi:hypothetical protein
MFLNDSFQNQRSAATVPNPFGINHRQRSPGANAEAGRFGAVDTPLIGKVELLEPAFQEFPTLLHAPAARAFCPLLIAAQKDVPAHLPNAVFDGRGVGFGERFEVVVRQRHG